jgi:YgiT-type zinc finger domain-containing protein
MDIGRKSKMICDICGQEGIHIRKVARTYSNGNDLLVIKDIPVISCPHCGESYLTAETLYDIERIRSHRNEFAVMCPVEVASLYNIGR